MCKLEPEDVAAIVTLLKIVRASGNPEHIDNGMDGAGWANLRGTNLGGARLSEANLDFSVFPLWCGALSVQADERIVRQLIYHTLRLAQNAKMDCALKAALFTKELIAQANLFHRVEKRLSIHKGISISATDRSSGKHCKYFLTIRTQRFVSRGTRTPGPLNLNRK